MNPLVLGEPGMTEPISLEIGDLQVAAFSNEGIGYGENQDRVLIVPGQKLFVINDGIGSSDGITAARHMSTLLGKAEFRAGENRAKALRRLFLQGNRELIESHQGGAQTCVTAVAINEKSDVEGAYAGDVELGIAHSDEQDFCQNFIHQMPDGNTVYSCIGGYRDEEKIVIDTMTDRLGSGDSLFLASDGVTANISLEAIMRTILKGNDAPATVIRAIFEECRERMEKSVNEKTLGVPRNKRSGKCDNMSAILVRRK